MKWKRPRPIARIKAGAADLQQARERPAVMLDWIRASLLRMWRIRGGGFYGLGFVFTFVYLEFKSVVIELSEAVSVSNFLSSQIFELFFKFMGESLGNFVQALIWPFLFMQQVGSWGIPILIGSFLAFDRWGKPAIHQWLPDLAPEAEEMSDSETDSETDSVDD